MTETKSQRQLITHPLVILALAILCNALWGSATPFIKIGYELILPPERGVPSIMLFAGSRFFLAGIITIAIYSIARRRFLYPKKTTIPKVLGVGAFQTVLQYIFFYVGLANTSGVKGTVASSANAFFALLVSSLIFRQEKLTAKKIFACVLGLTGIIIINIDGLDFNMNFLGDCFVLFSAMSQAFGSVLIKRFSRDEDPVIISGYQFVVGGTVMMAIGAAFGGTISFPSFSAVAVLIYLAFLSAVAYALWGVLLKYNPVSKVTIYSFTTPIFGVFLSTLLLDEASNVRPINLFITLILVSTGIFILNYSRKKPENKVV